jgi:peptidoglycan/LPS O-acetylase OafA/YrhL
MRTLRHIAALDGLRALAVLAVLCFHLGLSQAGYLGVDVFLVLSGFLITSLMLIEHEQTGRIDIRAFYVRRAYRLMPAFYAFVALGALLVLVRSQPTARRVFLDNAATSLLYVNNYFRIAQPEAGLWFGHSWSLSLEEQFYLLWPLCMRWLVGSAARRARLPWLLLGAVLAVACWRLWLVAHQAGELRIVFGLDTRSDELLLGCLLAALRHQGLLERAVRPLGWAGPAALLSLLALCLAAPTLDPHGTWLALGGYTGVALLSAVLVGSLTQPDAPLTRLLSWSPLSRLGQLSYGFYLWHYPVSAVLAPRLRTPATSLLGLLAAFLGSYGLAWLSFHGLEQPLQRRHRAALARRSADSHATDDPAIDPLAGRPSS